MNAPATIDEYLASVSAEQRAALEKLRTQIRAAAPALTETIAYGLPGFRLNGRYFMGFSATSTGCSLHSGKAPLEALRTDLGGYPLGKGTISFRTDEPLPDELVRRLVKVRLAEFGAG